MTIHEVKAAAHDHGLTPDQQDVRNRIDALRSSAVALLHDVRNAPFPHDDGVIEIADGCFTAAFGALRWAVER